MICSFKPHKILKKDFLKLNEKDIMFITNPGRMGDEDGSTFIIKDGNEFTIYRVDGWMYPIKGENNEVALEDFIKQFPQWYELWKHGNDENYQGKYKYLYMGFGNGLSVDHSLYSEFEPYLNKLVEEYITNSEGEERENLKYAAIYNVWQEAFTNMLDDKKYLLK